MIELEQVSFGYGENQETLSQVSATIARGECVLLCGASGCGKTTVTKLINGLIPAFTPGCRLEGRVMVNGLVPRETPMYELAQRVGSVFQNPKSQFFNLDTDSELAFGLENEGRPPEEIRRRVEQVAETLSPFSGHRGDPNRDPYGAKNGPGRDGFASGLPVFSLASEGIRQNFSHGLGRLLLGRCRDVGVGVQGEACREVSQHPRHRLDVHAVLEGQRSERVPEVVEPDPRQSRPLQHPVEHMQDAVRRDWAAGR